MNEVRERVFCLMHTAIALIEVLYLAKGREDCLHFHAPLHKSAHVRGGCWPYCSHATQPCV